MNGTKRAYPGPPRHVFVDAYGDPGLWVEKEATTAAFIVAAVLVEHEDIERTREALDTIRRKHFGNGPIKSKRVGTNDSKRLSVLAELMALPLTFAAVALDKARVFREGELLYPGLRFAPSFFKFTHAKLFEPLHSRHDPLNILADRIGSEAYMDNFREYVHTRQQNLFANPSFDFAESRENVFIQAADFIAGSLARMYDPKKLSPRAKEIHDVLRPKARFVIDWPKRFRPLAPVVRAASKHDDRVRQHCLARVWDYFEGHDNSGDPDVAARVEALRCLLFWYDTHGDREWVATGKLTDYLNQKCAEPMSAHHVRSKIIAPLRDCGVMIASSPQGYKIPSCVDDVRSYLEHTQKVVAPMLNRARAAREALLDLTDHELDVLDDPAFAALQEALDGRLFGAPRAAAKKAG
jgi:hypothetical protein